MFLKHAMLPSELLCAATQQGIAIKEAQILLAYSSGLSQTQLWLDCHMITEKQEKLFYNLVAQRLRGQPIAYLVGRREFFSLNFFVTPATLIPRPETELLVEKGLSLLENILQPKVLELGVGCGAVAITIAKYRPDALVVGTDISLAALKVAQKNAQHLLPLQRSCAIFFLQGNWLQGLNPTHGFHLILANPPYLAANDPHLSQGDLRFEPQNALSDGSDGLQALAAIIQSAKTHLLPGGYVVVEHGYQQAQQVSELLRTAGGTNLFCLRDLAGIERISGSCWIKP